MRKKWPRNAREGVEINPTYFATKYVKEDSCWIWLGAKNGSGYGSYGMMGAHRAAYIIANGEIPNGACVCHSCDNRLCVNPDHLWLGSPKQNMQDCKTKGRMSMPPRFIGSEHQNAKMTEEKVVLLRDEVAAGAKKRPTARKYGIDRRTVDKIVRRIAWRHV